MLYVENEIPATIPEWKKSEIARLRQLFRTEAYEDNGILRWKSNGRCVPMHSFRDAFCTTPTGQVDAESDEVNAFLTALSGESAANDRAGKG